MHSHYSQHHGFTLVETLVAISILLLVVVGPMTVAQKGIRSAYFANEQVVATFLAQEAIEAVRSYRDNVALSVYANPNGSVETSAWVNYLGTNCSSGCGYDSANSNFVSCGSNSNCLLQISAETKKYQHSNSMGNSPFTRRVTVGEVTVGDEPNGGVPVTVVVSWTSSILGSRNVTLQTWVYDHYQRYKN